MDGSWCPSCGYSVQPGTQFCVSCGQQLAAAAPEMPPAGASPSGAPGSALAGHDSPPPGSFMPPPLTPPPPSADSRLPWPPPPGSQPPAGWPSGAQPSLPATPQAPGQQNPPLSDTVERMLRPQGLFQNRQPPPAFGGYPQAPGQYPDQYPGQYGQPQPPDGPYGPGGQYGQNGPYGQYGQDGQYGQYGQDGSFGPQQYGPDGLPLAGGRPPRFPGRTRLGLPRGPLVPAVVAAALVVIVVTALLLSSSGGSGAGNGTVAGSSSSASASASSKSTQSSLAERQAAVRLSGLLSQSGTDRSDVIDAADNVQHCGKNLAKDARVFRRAADNRHALLGKLAKLPGRSALPAAMVRDLTGGWQASATVDSDLAKWASRAAARGCHKGNLHDPNLDASYAYDSKATADKKAFAKLWNRIARKDGLRTYQWGQL